MLWLSVLFGRSYALRESEPASDEQQEAQAQDLRDSFDASNDFLFDPTPYIPAQEPTSTTTELGSTTPSTSTSSASAEEFPGNYPTEPSSPTSGEWEEEGIDEPPLLPELWL